MTALAEGSFNSCQALGSWTGWWVSNEVSESRTVGDILCWSKVKAIFSMLAVLFFSNEEIRSYSKAGSIAKYTVIIFLVNFVGLQSGFFPNLGAISTTTREMDTARQKTTPNIFIRRLEECTGCARTTLCVTIRTIGIYAR